jgi:hypothetical protein
MIAVIGKLTDQIRCQVEWMVLLVNECRVDVLPMDASDELYNHHSVDKGITGRSMSVTVHCVPELLVPSSVIWCCMSVSFVIPWPVQGSAAGFTTGLVRGFCWSWVDSADRRNKETWTWCSISGKWAEGGEKCCVNDSVDCWSYYHNWCMIECGAFGGTLLIAEIPPSRWGLFW